MALNRRSKSPSEAGKDQERQNPTGGPRGLVGGNQGGGSPQGSRRTPKPTGSTNSFVGRRCRRRAIRTFRSGAIVGVPTRGKTPARCHPPRRPRIRRLPICSRRLRAVCTGSRSLRFAPRLRSLVSLGDIQHDRIADGLSLRQELPCRGLVARLMYLRCTRCTCTRSTGQSAVALDTRRGSSNRGTEPSVKLH